MDRVKKKRRLGLQAKLNILLIVSILLISVGLLLITYRVYCKKVNEFYYAQAERAARSYTDNVPYQYFTHLIKMTDTDEFRELRARALAADDAEIIKDWMRRQPPPDYLLEYYGKEDPYLDEEGDQYYTLYGVYKALAVDMLTIRQLFDVNSVYLQYYKDGETYTLVDPELGVMSIGEVEEPYEAFSQYVGNVRIPPTVYQYKNQWLCTACEPVEDEVDGEIVTVGMNCVDIDMNDVIRERHWFLFNSAVFIVALTLAAMAASMLLTRKLATRPLKLLAEGTMDFAQADGGFSKDDVIRLPIHSNDEIGDLYREIQSMQERIVDGTDRLTRITAERERVSTELRMATEIQSAMLPSIFPPFPDRKEFDLYASMDPAKEVGGDFYDFFMIDDDHLCLLIADVSDKGVPAALFMMSAKILINYRAQMGGTPGDIIAAVNAQMSKGNKSKMFVTVWMGILDVQTGVLTCTNAGHEYPVVRTGDVFRVFRDKHGLMIGVMPKAKYANYELTLEPGDAIFVYTDGVPEANNASGEMYGMTRLEAALNRAAGEAHEDILRDVRADVDAFVGDARQFDDLTMLCLEYRGPAGA